MIRRLAVALASLTAVASLASCGTFRNDQVAKVNGHTLSQRELKDMLNSSVGSQMVGLATSNGSVDGATIRSLISGWVGLMAIEDSGIVQQQYLADAEKSAAAKFGDDWAKAPAAMQRLAVLNAAISSELNAGALDRTAAINAIVTANVQIDPRYGRWDTTQNNVVAFG